MISVKGFCSSWPQRGEIELRNFYTKYRPSLPYVLRDTSFKINGGEKVFYCVIMLLNIME